MLLQSDQNQSQLSSTPDVDDESLLPAGVTDIGRERSVNEDRCATIQLPAATCYLVLDGMGGANGGEFAAQLSIDAVTRSLNISASSTEQDIEASLRLSFEEANRVIVLRRQNKKFDEMGTTIVGALIEGSAVAIAHVGDSRAYLVQEGGMKQLTADHSFVQHLVEQQRILEEETTTHPQSHILTQCIGSSDSIKVDTKKMWIWPAKKGMKGDSLLLCTDGLYSMVSEEEIKRVVSSMSPRRACDELIKLANERGGYDNISVSIIPLGGHLRDSVPPGWKKEVARRERRRGRERWWQRAFSRHFLVALIVGLFSAAASAALFFYVYVVRESLGAGYGG